jgi:hypothetical protein
MCTYNFLWYNVYSTNIFYFPYLPLVCFQFQVILLVNYIFDSISPLPRISPKKVCLRYVDTSVNSYLVKCLLILLKIPPTLYT